MDASHPGNVEQVEVVGIFKLDRVKYKSSCTKGLTFIVCRLVESVEDPESNDLYIVCRASGPNLPRLHFAIHNKEYYFVNTDALGTNHALGSQILLSPALRKLASEAVAEYL